jgi:hypothetical protein
MATWPSGSKASTTNLDAGTDRPSLARADIKQNVDNVNSIIDMFNIATPTNEQILKYNAGNSRFELVADAGQNINAGTGISVDQESDGGVTISSTVTDTNTTYTIDAETDGSNANLKLVGSDASSDAIQLVAGTNVALTVDSAGAVTIDATGTGIANVVEDTTPQLGGNLDGQGNQVQDVELINYKEDVYTLSYAATITPDVANGNVQKMSATGDFTFSAFSNPEAGQTLTLIVDHNGAARTLTSTMSFAGGDDALSTSDTVDIISVFYDGTTYYASIAKNFS